MKIVADENIPGLERFEAYGDLLVLPGREISRVHLQDAEALLVRSVTRVDAALVEGTALEFIGSCTIGEDHISQACCQKNGITVVNAPGSNANSVAEYVLACLLALKRKPAENRVAIVGYGNVGKRLETLLSSLGYCCYTCDPLLPAATMPNPVSLDEALKCEVVSFHTPLTHEGAYPTWHLLDKARIRQMQQGALLINTGRGAVIDNAALLDHLEHCPDAAPECVLDVWEGEPLVNLALMQHVSIATPHIAGYSVEGKLAATAIIHQAFCRHFGFEQKQTPCSTDQKEMLSVCDALEKAVLSVYDPRRDDSRMRTALSPGQLASFDEPARAAAFDRLRKAYWPRREFSHFRLEAGFSAELKQQLLLLGFIE